MALSSFTSENVDRIYTESGAPPAERESFKRGLLAGTSRLPDPMKAGLYGAGAGVILAMVTGRSIIGWGIGGYVLGSVGAGLMDVGWVGGYAMGFGECSEARK